MQFLARQLSSIHPLIVTHFSGSLSLTLFPLTLRLDTLLLNSSLFMPITRPDHFKGIKLHSLNHSAVHFPCCYTRGTIIIMNILVTMFISSWHTSGLSYLIHFHCVFAVALISVSVCLMDCMCKTDREHNTVEPTINDIFTKIM